MKYTFEFKLECINKYISKERINKYFNEWVWPDAFAECASVSKVVSLMNNK